MTHAKFSLIEILTSLPEVTIVDIGASLIGGTIEPYMALVERGGAKLIGFEPDVVEREKLEARYSRNCKFLPLFIGRGGPATFHQTNWVYTGSLLEPNSSLLDRFQMLSEVTLPTAKHAIDTHRLDDVPGIVAMDFLKMDVQGGELAVLEGAEQLLKDCLVIQTEVEFIQLYKEQPLFADIDSFLRARGFEFHRFTGFGSRPFKPFLSMSDTAATGSQQIWSDAVYVRSFMKLDQLTTEQLLKLAIILNDIIGSVDMCLFVLSELDRRQDNSTQMQLAYISRLNQTGGHHVGLSIAAKALDP
ncbi:MAG: FkbM family methyltransferase [Rhodospirillaceae bacterium]